MEAAPCCSCHGPGSPGWARGHHPAPNKNTSRCPGDFELSGLGSTHRTVTEEEAAAALGYKVPRTGWSVGSRAPLPRAGQRAAAPAEPCTGEAGSCSPGRGTPMELGARTCPEAQGAPGNTPSPSAAFLVVSVLGVPELVLSCLPFSSPDPVSAV